MRDAPPPFCETDVTEGGMGGGGAIALLVLLSSAIVDGLFMCSGKKYPFVVDLT